MSGFPIREIARPVTLFLVDHRDSFTYNLVHLLRSLRVSVDVADYQETKPKALVKADGILLGPGPHSPAEVTQSVALVRDAAQRQLPLLGVCLGHQALGVAWGGRVRRATRVVHGVVSPIRHKGTGLFRGVAHPGEFVRYHSLVLEEPLPSCLRVLARDVDGDVAAIAHRELPQWGVQFHPESLLSQGGAALLGNFLNFIGRGGAR